MNLIVSPHLMPPWQVEIERRVKELKVLLHTAPPRVVSDQPARKEIRAVASLKKLSLAEVKVEIAGSAIRSSTATVGEASPTAQERAGVSAASSNKRDTLPRNRRRPRHQDPALRPHRGAEIARVKKRDKKNTSTARFPWHTRQAEHQAMAHVSVSPIPFALLPVVHRHQVFLS